VVKFNVGGQPYRVSRSFLLLHPQTMIAKSASDRWQETPESEIFIDRDGEMFRHVLSYLRDGRVDLPLTTTKKGLLAELAYYGVEGVNEKDVDDSIQGPQALQGAGYLKQCSSSLMVLSESACLAKLCIDKWLATESIQENGSFKLEYATMSTLFHEDTNIIFRHEKLLQETNAHLSKVGLCVTDVRFKQIDSSVRSFRDYYQELNTPNTTNQLQTRYVTGTFKSITRMSSK